uniref:FTH domain-containing protein n=1 Tax=Panagrellus redivivus TaxID=6233 RepID=A0A7E4W1Q8_PANRE
MTIEEFPDTYYAELLADTPVTSPVSSRKAIKSLLRKSFSPTITKACEGAIINKVVQNKMEIAFKEKCGTQVSFNDTAFKSLQETHLCVIKAPGIRLFQANLNYHMPLFKKFEFHTSSLMLMECPCAPEFFDALAACTRSVKLTDINLEVNHEFLLNHMLCTFPHLETVHLYLTNDKDKRYDADWAKILVEDSRIENMKHLTVSGSLKNLFQFDASLLIELFKKAEYDFQLTTKIITKPSDPITDEEWLDTREFFRPAMGLKFDIDAESNTINIRGGPKTFSLSDIGL